MVWTDGTGDLPAYVRNEDVMLGGVFVGGDATSGLTDGTYRELGDRPVPLLVAVDDEGGQVQRLDALVGDLPSAADQAAEWSPARTRRAARDRASAMRELGITMDLAPVVDLADPAEGGVIGDRSYSTDPDTAARYAAAFGEGLQLGGVLPTLKHFPGHGRAAGDSHTTLPVTPPLDSLRRQDLVPYQRILSSGTSPWAVMMGHLVVPGLTADDRPASLDPAAYAYLRDELGFTGLVVTDELTGMQAVSADYGPEAAAATALAAGADLLLLAAPGNLTELLDGLEARVRDGSLAEDRVTAAADAVLAVKSCAVGDATAPE